MNNEERFLKLKEKSKEKFVSIGKIMSPYFKDYINLNSDGFHHLSYGKNRTSRTIDEKFLKFLSLDYMYEILEESSTIQEYREILLNNKIVKYYGMIAINKNLKRKTRVIVRQIGAGTPHFWSVMPYSKVKNGMQKLSLDDIQEI